jgi:hypothetical protein
VLNENLKFIYDYATNTHIFIDKEILSASYTLNVRSPSVNYLKADGVLVTGCPQRVNQSQSLLSARRRRRRQAESEKNNDDNLECAFCDRLFPAALNFSNTFDENNEISSRLLWRMCRFDCAQIGDDSLSQMLLQVNASYSFAIMGDNETNVTRLAQSVLAKINNTIITTTTTTTTTTTATSSFRPSESTSSDRLKNIIIMLALVGVLGLVKFIF